MVEVAAVIFKSSGYIHTDNVQLKCNEIGWVCVCVCVVDDTKNLPITHDIITKVISHSVVSENC